MYFRRPKNKTEEKSQRRQRETRQTKNRKKEFEAKVKW